MNFIVRTKRRWQLYLATAIFTLFCVLFAQVLRAEPINKQFERLICELVEMIWCGCYLANLIGILWHCHFFMYVFFGKVFRTLHHLTTDLWEKITRLNHRIWMNLWFSFQTNADRFSIHMAKCYTSTYKDKHKNVHTKNINSCCRSENRVAFNNIIKSYTM